MQYFLSNCKSAGALFGKSWLRMTFGGMWGFLIPDRALMIQYLHWYDVSHADWEISLGYLVPRSYVLSIPMGCGKF